MASLVLGVAGAVVGSFVGMPQLGFLLGSAIGSYIDQSMQKGAKQEGPRLHDRRVQSSSYGMMIPIIQGSMAVYGNVIWASDLQEESRTEESGGKGGPPASETTLYSYFGNFAVSLCEGPMHSISRIWANGRLWYDASASSQGYTSWVFYKGDETQLPDPTIESFLGVGNVPAYRGQAYVVFTHLPLEQFGNQIPQLLFEVNQLAQVTNSIEILGSRALTFFNTPMIAVGSNGHLWQWEFLTVDSPSHANPIYRLDPFTGAILSTWAVGTGSVISPLLPISGGRFWGTWNVFDNRVLSMINPDNQTVTRAHTSDDLLNEFAPAQWSALGDDLLGLLPGPTANDRLAARISATSLRTAATGANVGVSGLQWSLMTSLDDQYARGANDGTYYYAISQNNPGGSLYRIYKFLISDLSLVAQNTPPTGSGTGYMVLHHQGKLYATTSGFIDRWNAATLTHEARLTVSNLCSVVALCEDPRYMLASHKGAASTLINVSTFSIVQTFPHPTMPIGQPVGEIGMDRTTNRLLGIGYNPDFKLFRVRTASLGPEMVSLADVVTAYCARADLQPDQLDVSQLIPVALRGTILSRPCAARDAIEPLAGAYLFDGVESGALLKFVLRGGSVSRNIGDADLASMDGGGDGAVPKLQIQRSQDVDLPRTVNVTHFQPSRDYQQGSQYARRFGGFSDSDITVEVPVALSAGEAKTIAEAWLYNAWMERQRFTFATSIKYAGLEPSDLISLHGFVIRINKRTEDGMLLRWEGVNDASQIYLQTAPGAEGSGAGSQTPPAPQPSTVAYLDIPLLRDVDDVAGFYLAANGEPPTGWPGASVYKSIDSGQTYSPYYAITAPSVMGVTQTTLATWQAKNNIVDELNTVNVAMNGALSSISLTAMLNGGNMMLIGSEVVQFRDATLIGTNTYRLSGLLRGRLGTEWANGSHTSSDRAVLLTTNVRNTTHPAVEIGLSRIYKAVTIGHAFESAVQTSFANTGVRHEPYAPCDIGGGIEANGDWTINWKRRTRLSDGWQDSIDAPLGETSELYAVEILSGATVVRTLSALTTPTATYTAADQTTDFGSPQTTLSVRIYQLSSVTGRGYPGVATLPSP